MEDFQEVQSRKDKRKYVPKVKQEGDVEMKEPRPQRPRRDHNKRGGAPIKQEEGGAPIKQEAHQEPHEEEKKGAAEAAP